MSMYLLLTLSNKISCLITDENEEFDHTNSKLSKMKSNTSLTCSQGNYRDSLDLH